MNHKFEEKLIALAYGELDTNEAEQVRQQIAIDPDLQSKFEAYQYAFHGSSTPEWVPPPSLSNERLRRAILTQELRKDSKPGFAKLTFGFATLTAALLAVAVVPKFLQSPDIKLPSLGPAIASNEVSPDVAELTNPTPDALPKTVSSSPKKPAVTRKSTRKPTLYASKATRPVTTKLAASQPAETLLDEQLAGIAGGVTSAAVEREDADSVVFISGGGTTEGSKATEMKAPTGVPIGG